MKLKKITICLRGTAVFLVMLLLAMAVSPALADTSGPNLPDSGLNDTGVGSQAWSNPTGITGDDTDYASANLPTSVSSRTSNYLVGTDFDFAIPSEAAIDGIMVRIARYASGGSVYDNRVNLVKGGAIQTSGNKASGNAWPSSGLPVLSAAYGGASDKWSNTWTPADINAAGFGVALSVTNWSLGSRNVYVDFMQITVNYTVPGTSTVVDCGAGTPVVAYGDEIACEVTVTRTFGSSTPTGAVSLAGEGSGTFTACTLAGSDGTATCTADYTPGEVGDGAHLITADYPGDVVFTGSSGTQTVTVEKAIPTLSITNSPQTYDGSPHAAVVDGSVEGVVQNVRYDDLADVPVAAGTYAVTADFTPDDGENYESLLDAPAGNFVIEKAIPTISVTNSPVTYTSEPQAAELEGSVLGEFTNVLYNGSPVVPTEAGTYAVTADFAPDDAVNYESLTGAAAGDFVIEKADPFLYVSNSPMTYDGSPQAATVEADVAGAVSNVLYNDSATVPTGAGTYAVTADFVPTDTANYNSLTAAAAGDFVIEKADPVLSVANSPVTYNSAPQTATVEADVAGLVSNVLYDGSATAPTDAGTYAVTADFVPTDTNNYNSLTAASAGDFVIEKADPVLTVTNSPVIYDGTPQTAVVEADVPGTISGLEYDGSATVPTDAGTYAVTADFVPTDTDNYNSLSDAAAGDFIIQKADPVLTVTNSPVIYDGTPQAAVVEADVPGTVSGLEYNGSATVPADAGTYAVTADFVPTDTANYNSLTGASAGDFVIGKADPVLSVTNSPVTYNGSPQAAVVEGDVPGTASNLSYDGSATAPTNAGTYAVTADFVPTDTNNYNTLTAASAGNFVIEKADPVLTVTNSPVIYNGAPQAAVVESSTPGVISNVLYDGSATLPTDVGTYAVTAGFVPTDTANYNSLTGASAGDFAIVLGTPGLTLVMTPSTTLFTNVGDIIDFTYVLTNSGDAALAGPFMVDDDKVTVNCPATASLAPDATLTCNGSYTITQADFDAGSVTNTATASGSYAGNPVTSNTVEATITKFTFQYFLPLIFR
jgi:hypothetical protein